MFDSLQYTINESLAPVISMSYGSCEQNFTTQEATSIAALAQQANAQGITIVGPAGDKRPLARRGEVALDAALEKGDLPCGEGAADADGAVALEVLGPAAHRAILVTMVPC